MKKHRILLVDDDPFTLSGIGKNLECEGFDVTTAESGEKAIGLLKKQTFELVITDQVMGEVNGIQVLKRAKELEPDTMVIILTGYEILSDVIDALRLNADDYLLKPCEPEEILFRVKSCLEKHELKRKVRIYEDILPVCRLCKKIRDDSGMEPGKGRWMAIEDYVFEKENIMVSHSYCPECAKKMKDDF